MEKAVAESKRFNNHQCLLMIDIDDFKTVNDTFGHLAGDMVLRNIGKVLLEHTRACDIAVRYGGEEFAVLLTENRIEGACCFAERMREHIESCAMNDIGEKRVTVSIGVTKFRQDDSCVEDVIKRADGALYAAKLKGKNTVQAMC